MKDDENTFYVLPRVRGELLRIVNNAVTELHAEERGVSGLSASNPDLHIHLETSYKAVANQLQETHCLTIHPTNKPLLASHAKPPHITAYKDKYFVTAHTSLEQRALSSTSAFRPATIMYKPQATPRKQRLTLSTNSTSPAVTSLAHDLYEQIDRII